MMTMTRPPAVAGQFYPNDPQELMAELDTYLQEADLTEHGKKLPKAIIVPHAGYIYSGPTAAKAFIELVSFKRTIKRIVLMGPSHRVGFYGLATSQCSGFMTPLGKIQLDREAVQSIERLEFVNPIDQAHEFEHSLEVQLPFLQKVLDDFLLVPIVVGDAEMKDVAQVIDLLWGGPETVFVISSDLSHFLDYDSAVQKDRKTAEAIEALQADLIHFDDACGRNPVKGLIASSLKHGLHPTRLALCNSGDTAGDKGRVVGYGAWRFD